MSDRRRNKKIDTRNGKANAVLRKLLLCGHETGASNTAKFSVFISVFVPTLTYGHGSWILTEMILSQVQAAEIGFLR